jgi:hypothetical protein
MPPSAFNRKGSIMNTNLLHNVLNIAIVALPVLEQFDWTPFMSDSTALKVSGALALTKLLINAVRDGVGGMAKVQPPVK